MSKLLTAAFVAVLGLTSVSVFAKEVQLNDQERTELRQRAERIQREGLTGRTVKSTDAHAVQHAPKAKKAKHNTKTKPKAPQAKGNVSKKTT